MRLNWEEFIELVDLLVVFRILSPKGGLMGSNCCKCGRKAVQGSEITLADLQEHSAYIREIEIEEARNDDFRELETEETRNDDLREMEMEETKNDDVPLEPEPPSPNLRPSEVLERPPRLVSFGLPEKSSTKESPRKFGHNELACYRESNILWSTGSFSNIIPSGFYSVIQDARLKLFKNIPTLDELRALGDEGLKADVILVDFEKDKKLYRLRQLIIKLVARLNSNPAKAIKKIGELVVSCYKTPQSRRKTTQSFGCSLLGQIKHGSCRVRAILFKVLADAAGYESKLVMGCPSGLKCSASVDSYNHMSAVVMLNTVEMMVDLKRYPVQLLPMSNQAISMAHISVAGNGSCHSPSAPYSPMYGYVDRIDHESLSRSEPNFLRRSQRNVIRKHHTADSSPEHIYVRTREWFMLNGGKKPVQESCDDASRTESHDLQTNISQIWNEVAGSPMFQNKPLLPNGGRNIDFSELEVGTLVGIGCSAKVFRGTWNETEVAIKMFSDQELTVENITEFCNEISIHSRARHPNVVTFLGACTKPPQVSLVTEYMEKGSLYHLLHSTDEMANLSWKEKLKMLCDICRGLMCIHRKGIVHRDLKSANCLLSNDWTVKICDFGLSKMMEGTTVNDTVPAGTPQWVAPEVIRNEHFSQKCDIFSLGVIIWELCTLSQPWEGVPKEKVIDAVANEGARLEIPEGPLAQLIEDCWSEEPEKRPNCAQILTYLATCENSLP